MFSQKHTAVRMNRVKKAHRSDIKVEEWAVAGYAKSNICEKLSNIDEGQIGFQPVTVVERESLTADKFAELFLHSTKPVVVRGGFEHWPAILEKRWDIEALLHRFKHTLFKVGEDDNGRKLKVKMKTFVDYMRHQEDDSPLYLFESGMEGMTGSLRADYSVPDLFPDDFLNLVGREYKPPHRWFCIGPKRSGTTVHRDPMGTAAWNAVTEGRKRWVLFEPSEPKALVKGRRYKQKGEDDEAIHYFDYILPRLREANPKMKVYECIQQAGDLIFVPGQWWHGVINLSDTVAVTHNYCGWDNIDDVYYRVSRQRKMFCARWVKNMKKFSPPLYRRVKDLRRDKGKTVDCTSSASSSSDSSDSSDYSSSDAASDIDWEGFPHSMLN